MAQSLRLAPQLALVALISTHGHIALANPTGVLAVDSASSARVVIDPSRTVRAQTPSTLFSFNMPYLPFQRDLWDWSRNQVKTPVVRDLQAFAGSVYRYPGGLLSNHFNADNAMLPLATRIQKVREGARGADYPRFGVGEYLTFTKAVGGTPWFSLNIQGDGTHTNPVEWPSAKMAQINKELAQFVKARTPGASVRHYQLGNELDRAHYQWPHSKYVSRSRDSINAVRSVDSNARFVAFLREFNWRYRYGKTGTSYAQSLFNDVLKGLPMVNDFSLHYYYDGRTAPNERYWHVPLVIDKINKGLAYAKNARPGGDFRIWITEHSKRVLQSGGTPEPVTRLDAGLGLGDFLLAVMQIPEVKGTAVQGLQGTPRRVFFKDLKWTASLAALRVLRSQPYERVVASKTYSPNSSGYPGGYDIRAVGFTDSTGSKLGVSAVNRATKSQSLQIKYARFAGKSVRMKHYYVAGPAGVAPIKVERNYRLVLNPGSVEKRFNSSGVLTVMLPPSSVSTIVFE